MKSYIIISAAAFATGTLASAALDAHDIENLVAREIDPKTMDPTRLSVLSVLKTAIPSGSDFPLPTGGFEPEWFSKLPADVKSLLPSLYPAEAPVSSSSSAILSASTAELAMSTTSVAVSASVPTLSGTSQLTVTKTLQYATSATAGSAMPSNGSSTASNSTNGTLGTATPLPSAPISNGAKSASEVELLAAFAWVGLAAGFVLFA